MSSTTADMRRPASFRRPRDPRPAPGARAASPLARTVQGMHRFKTDMQLRGSGLLVLAVLAAEPGH